MFERFTDRARRSVVLAQEEASGLGHNYIGTEHLLLGLIAEGRGPGAVVLDGLGIRLEKVRRQVETIIGRGTHQVSGHVPFTPRAKKILELSVPEADRYGHRYIDTGHILLAIMAEGDGVAALILTESGADEKTVREQMQSLYGAGGTVPGDVAWHEILPVVEAIEERLSVIEQHLGIAAEGQKQDHKSSE